MYSFCKINGRILNVMLKGTFKICVLLAVCSNSSCT